MGCVSQNKKDIQENSPKKRERTIPNPNKENDVDSFQDVQLLQHSKRMSKKKQSQNPTNQTANKQQDLNDNFIGLDELIASADEGTKEEWESHNTTSKIFKLSKKTKNKEKSTLISRNTLDSNLSPDRESTQCVQAVITKEQDNFKFSISVHDMDFQFFLPNCRAGPLVIPYVGYQVYKI